MVITDRIENIDNLGFFIYRLCHDKETYKLQRRETIKGIQKREASNCVTIRHFENKFAVETLICSWTIKKNIMEKNLIQHNPHPLYFVQWLFFKIFFHVSSKQGFTTFSSH